jgi:hypothetical protein
LLCPRFDIPAEQGLQFRTTLHLPWKLSTDMVNVEITPPQSAQFLQTIVGLNISLPVNTNGQCHCVRVHDTTGYH